MSDSDIYNRPSTPRAEYVTAAKDITLIRDLLAGTRRMHEKFKDYIVKFASEKPHNYKRRATAEKVYGGLARVLSAAIGMLFAKSLLKSENFATTMDTWDNLDRKGTSGDVFVKRRAKDAMADGFCVILVDHPPQPKDIEVHAGNDKALGLMPFWAPYFRADVISWVTAAINNVDTVVQVVLREGSSTRVGRFGVQPVTRYRICSLVWQSDGARAESAPQWMAVWELLEERADGAGKVTYPSVGNGVFREMKNGTAFSRIPAAIVYGNDSEAHFVAQPPLLDVAWANLSHWRKATNLTHYEDMCALPQPTLLGQLQTDPVSGAEIPFTLGPTNLVRLKEGGDFRFTEVTGSSLEQLRLSCDEKKQEIGELGMSFLAHRPNGVESAEKRRLDTAAENASLGTSAQAVEDGINLALEFDAQYRGIPKEEAPTIRINRDFDLQAMDAPTMAIYLQAVVQAGLPARTMLEIWQQGGRIPPDADLDRIEAEMLAGASAIAEQKRIETQNAGIASAA